MREVLAAALIRGAAARKLKRRRSRDSRGP